MALTTQQNVEVISGPDVERPSAALMPSTGVFFKPLGVSRIDILERNAGVNSWVSFFDTSSLILTNPAYWIDAVAGSDSNAGTVSAPFRTIDYALKTLSVGWYGFATLNLVAGTHTIGDRTVIPSGMGNSTATAGSLLINGLTSTDSGLGARVASGGSQGSQQTFGTVIDTTGGLTVNAHRGQILRFTSGAMNTRTYQITSNTATTFTVTGPLASASIATSAYVVEFPAATITWASSQVLQGHGGILGLQNLNLTGPGGANFLSVSALTLAVQIVRITNIGSAGLSLTNGGAFRMLSTFFREFGNLTIPQLVGVFLDTGNGPVGVGAGSVFNLSRSVVVNSPMELSGTNFVQWLDTFITGNSYIRCIYASILSMDRVRMDTVTPAPVTSAIQDGSGAAVVVSKGCSGSLLHMDISNTPATTAPGDAILTEDHAILTCSANTGTGNAGLGTRVRRHTELINLGTTTLTGTAGEVKLGDNAITTWALVADTVDLVELCLAYTP